MTDKTDGAEPAEPLDRRGFLGEVAVLLGGLVAAAGGAVAAVYLAGPALGRGGEPAGTGAAWAAVPGAGPSFEAGPVRHSVVVESSAGWAVASSTQAVFLDAAETGEPRAFSARCPHEGCQIDWEAQRGLYVCPCHNSEFTREGGCRSGPAKRGLDPIDVRRTEDGAVEVQYKLFALDTAERIVVG